MMAHLPPERIAVMAVPEITPGQDVSQNATLDADDVPAATERFIAVELPGLLSIANTAPAATLEALAAVLGPTPTSSTTCRRLTPTGRPRPSHSRSSAATGRWLTLPPWSLIGRSRCNLTGAPTSTTGWP